MPLRLSNGAFGTVVLLVGSAGSWFNWTVWSQVSGKRLAVANQAEIKFAKDVGWDGSKLLALRDSKRE